jgi:hypothetical protein
VRNGPGKLLSSTGSIPQRREARKSLILALSEFTLAAKEVGQAVPAAMCPQ